MRGLLSKEYAKARAATMSNDRNDPGVKPGDPYPFQNGTNPFMNYLNAWPPPNKPVRIQGGGDARSWEDAFYAGTTSIQAADAAGWVISVTPSGGWIPAVIAGRTGIGLSQRAQSFVTDPGREPVQCHRARQAPARDAYADARAQGRSAVDGVLRAGRRLAGSESPPVLPEHPRVRHDAAAGRGSTEHELVPDAELVSGSLAAAGPHAGRVARPRRRCAPSCRRWATRCNSPSARRVPLRRSGSIASTARCGAPQAITVRTTASRGDKRSLTRNRSIARSIYRSIEERSDTTIMTSNRSMDR